MNADTDSQNKNANNKVGISYNFWLGSVFWNMTFIPLSDEDVKEIRELLDGNNGSEVRS